MIPAPSQKCHPGDNLHPRLSVESKGQRDGKGDLPVGGAEPRLSSREEVPLGLWTATYSDSFRDHFAGFASRPAFGEWRICGHREITRLEVFGFNLLRYSKQPITMPPVITIKTHVLGKSYLEHPDQFGNELHPSMSAFRITYSLEERMPQTEQEKHIEWTRGAA